MEDKIAIAFLGTLVISFFILVCGILPFCMYKNYKLEEKKIEVMESAVEKGISIDMDLDLSKLGNN